MVTDSVDSKLLQEMMTSDKVNLKDLSFQQPVLLVFLRHFGCTFCREALADISEARKRIEEIGTKLVFVHMASNEIAEDYFDRFNLQGATHISDPECEYYAAFGLVKGNFTQLFGLQTWIRGFSAGVVKGHGIGPQLGDDFQMPGVFVIVNGAIKESFIHKVASERPDYYALAKCCQTD